MEDIVLRISESNTSRLNHEVLMDMREGDSMRRLTTLKVWYRVSSGVVFIESVSLATDLECR
ncbi:hypothetical protein BDV18DRAFT_119455 [Aspergillus unguis]